MIYLPWATQPESSGSWTRAQSSQLPAPHHSASHVVPVLGREYSNWGRGRRGTQRASRGRWNFLLRYLMESDLRTFQLTALSTLHNPETPRDTVITTIT